MKPFVHLHTHSHFSLLTALPKIKDLVRAAKEENMTALALTDNGNLYGAIQFYKECIKEGIKPIIGIDAYLAARTRFDKEAGIDNRRTRLILLAKDLTGYKNLLKLVTLSHTEGFYYKPRLDRELLTKYHHGLIAILPSFSGETSGALKAHDKKRAVDVLSFYQNTFGKSDVYLEITYHPEIEGHKNLMADIKKLSRETNVPLLATHDVYYLKIEDHKAREVMMKIQSGIPLGDTGGIGEEKEDFSFISSTKAYQYFKDTPEAIENTLKVANRCNLQVPLGEWHFPKPKIESGRSYDEELEHLAREGLKRLGVKGREAMDRLEYELKVIRDKGYSSYFLVVADLMRYAHENGILTTIRGSVAGSLTTYCLGITNVNPLEYLLPFERFLNPDRPSAPDIDMDFADNRRDEMIEYARKTYGEEKVAQIGTFGTMMARAAVRDVARALGHPYGTGDRIAKLIPIGSQGFPMTIDRALSMEPELKKLYKEDADAKEIINLAKKIEGCARHISVHAAGVVISPVPLTDVVPLQFDPKGGKLITQYDMRSVDEDAAGLLKFDFLGLKNLAILADAVERVKKILNVDIDIEQIPLDDKMTFEMLARGETMGLFQLNGAAMTKFLKDLRPTTIDDINAMVALYRPGPMKNIPEYIARKHGQKPITYSHPKMKNFLERSYGILVYQDDLLSTALEIAGYTWESVDKFRKAVGKKIPEEMAKQHVIFVEGCRTQSEMTEKEAEKLWELFEPFQGYGFNKAHAACYGKVAYQTAYMKANFPEIYMAAVLTADSGDVEKISEIIIECKRMGIEVLPPDVNESYGDFAVVKNEENDVVPKIRFGLHSIKNFGEGIGDVIIQERKGRGKFTSLENFLERIIDRNLNKKSLEALIKCGSLDQFADRGVMLGNLDLLLTYNREHAELSQNQDSLFGALPDNDTDGKIVFIHNEPADPAEKLKWEKELLGLYVSGHPLDKYREKLAKRSKDISALKEELRDGMLGVISGIVEEVKPILTKSGEKMAFVRVADFGGAMEIVVFPRIFSEHHDLIAPEQCIAIKGRMSSRNGEKSMIAEAVKALL